MNQPHHSIEEDFMLSWSPELRRALRSRPEDDEMLTHDNVVKKTRRGTYGTGRALETRLFINNEFVHSVSGRIFSSVSLGDVQESTCGDVDKAVYAAKNVMEFPSQWRNNESTMYRYELLLKLAELIERDKDYLMELESVDNNLPFGVGSSTDIDLVVNCYRYYADWSCRIMSVGRREPVGVCACIIPSCLPLLIQAWKLGPALACGNSIVMQSLTKVSVSALHVCGLIREAGFPPGVVNMINGYNSLVKDYLVTHPDIEKVSREVSPEVTEVIKRYASTARVQPPLQLGGQEPLIVHDPTHLEVAIKVARGGICRCRTSQHFGQNGINLVTGQTFEILGKRCHCLCSVQYARCGLQMFKLLR